jgi:hypothetical protein
MSRAKSTPKIKSTAPEAVVEQEVIAKTPEGVAEPTPIAVVAAVEPVAETAPAKATKVSSKKPKLIRDSFTFPENDYALLASLKLRALANGHEIKKSELLRAGLIALQSLSDADLVKLLATVERIKTGRPSKK